jgi:hypothetical protein
MLQVRLWRGVGVSLLGKSCVRLRGSLSSVRLTTLVLPYKHGIRYVGLIADIFPDKLRIRLGLSTVRGTVVTKCVNPDEVAVNEDTMQLSSYELE